LTREEFLNSLVNNENGTVLNATAMFPMDDCFETKMPLISILNLDESKISKEGKLVLDILENDPDSYNYKDFMRFKWKLWALTCLQDIFPSTIYNDFTHEAYNALYYFYYESLHLIREFFYVGLNNFLKAADHLLRTILEFNIRQAYFNDKCDIEHSLKPVQTYLDKGHCPSNQSMLNSFLPNNSIGKATKVNIQNLIKILSNTSSHAFNPDDSSRYHGKLHFEYTPDSMVFWIKLDYLLTPILWSYYLLYPMAFQPRDIIKKFGFNYPAGLYITENQFRVFKNSLLLEDQKILQAYSNEQQVVVDLNEFFYSQSDLTYEQIKQTWRSDDGTMPEKIHLGYLQTVAQLRGLKEICANNCTLTKRDTSDLPDNFLEQHSSLAFWQKNYAKVKL